MEPNLLMDALSVELGHAAARRLQLRKERLLSGIGLLHLGQPVLGVFHLTAEGERETSEGGGHQQQAVSDLLLLMN